ncbi:MAG: DUF5784 family protein, partial [Halobacteria archaeon]|nr:DUF5784 family protein [Halobacteria archaeon]
SSFDDADWRRLRSRKPSLSHEPAVVFRLRPSVGYEGYVTDPAETPRIDEFFAEAPTQD